MSADPTPPPSPDPAASVPPGETPVEALPQKRRYKRPEAAEPVPSAPGVDPDNEIIVLSSLLQNLLARKEGGEVTETEARGKINRFVSRKDGPAAPSAPVAPPTPPPTAEPSRAPQPPPPARETPAPAALRPAIAGPEGMAAIAFPKFEPRLFQPDATNNWWDRSGSTWGRGVLYFAFTAALALAAFLAGRRDEAHHPVVSDAKAVPGLTTQALDVPTVELLEKALRAEQSDDFDAARNTADNLLKASPDNATLVAYSATVDTRLGRLNDVEASLSRRIGPNTPPDVAATLNQAQAFNYCRRREFERACDCFAAVARVRPLDARNFLRWGEALRRLGRLADAVDKFHLALLRLPVGAPSSEGERDYLAYKTRLTQVELGREADFKSELAQHLAEPMPGGYWLLTGAAAALQKNDLPTVVDLLTKARTMFSPEQFTTLLEDYFFRAAAYHPEMNAFLTPSSPEHLQGRRLRMDYFVDP